MIIEIPYIWTGNVYRVTVEMPRSYGHLKKIKKVLREKDVFDMYSYAWRDFVNEVL